MAKWALLMFVITTVGVAYIAMTLQASRETLRQAGMATDAANRTVDVTQRIGELQHRAWILRDGIFAGPVEKSTLDGEPVTNGIVVGFAIKNYGQSPAFIIKTTIDFRVVSTGSELPHFEYQEQALGGDVCIGAGEGTKLGAKVLGDVDASRFRRNEIAIAAHLRIEYRGVFDEAGGDKFSTLMVTGWIKTGQRGPTGMAHFERAGPQNQDH